MKNICQIFAPPPPQNRSRLTLTFLFALAMLPDLLLAQFFTEYQPNQIQWPSGAYARYQLLQDPALSKDVKIVSTLDVRNAQSNGILSFQIPGTTTSLQAEASLIKDDLATTGFIWSGKLTNAPGYISFIYRDGKTAGFIQVGKDFYELSPIDNYYQFLIRRNTDYSASDACGVPPSPEEPPPPTEDCDYSLDYNTCPALITVLLILTPEAKLMVENMYGNVDLFALLGQSSVNTAFWNSDIPNKEIRVKWVVKSDFPFDPEMNFNIDMQNLAVFSEPERTQNNADMVVLIPHVDYPAIGGIANLPNDPDPNRAFSIVEVKGFVSKFVLAHELGHNWGCHHNWPIDLGHDVERVCAHGKRWLPINTFEPDWFQELDSWRTLMAEPVNPNQPFEYELDGGEIIYIQIVSDYPILHYSNPSVFYNGEPTGRSTQPTVADNADHIRKVGCEINTYNATNELSVNITASVCTSPITLAATITPPSSGLPGLPPYTVYWFWNTSGIFGTGTPPQFLGSGQILTLTNYPACPVFWVKCVVVSSDNVVISRIQKVVVAPCICYPDRPGRGRDAESSLSTRKNTSLYPNPVSQGVLFVQSKELLADESISYKVVDMWGRAVLDGQSARLDGDQLALSVEGLSDGLYFLSLDLPDGKPENHKFIITKSH